MGELDSFRESKLNEVIPYWNYDKKDINKLNKELLINSEWKSKVPAGHTPIDSVYDGDDLYICLSHDIVDCETLLIKRETIINKLNCFDYSKIISATFDMIHESYVMLLPSIFMINLHELEFDKLKEFYLSFSFKDKDDMKDKMERSISTLLDKEKEMLYLRFGINGKCHMLGEIATIYGVKSVERPRQTIAKALRKLRHPRNSRILRGEEEEVKVVHENKSHIFDESTDISKLELDTRSHNALKRNYIYTIGDLLNICKGETQKDFEIYKVRNLGKKSIDQILFKLREKNLLKEEV